VDEEMRILTFRWLASFALLWAASLPFLPAAAAQQERVVTTPSGYRLISLDGRSEVRLPSATVILRDFERAETGRGDEGGSAGVTMILRRPTAFPRATVDTIQNGLEHLSLASDHPPVRLAAASSLHMPGSSDLAQPDRDVVERMLRVYRQSTDEAVRTAILETLHRVTERQQALGFVRSVAMQAPAAEDFPGAARTAIGILAFGKLGPEGCTALAEIVRQGHIRHAGESAGAAYALAHGPCRDPRP
jgi:hypothetical protein